MNTLSQHPTLVGDVPACTKSAGWRWRTVYTAAEVGPLNDAMVRALAEAGFGDKDVFSVRLALEEAVVNAIKHGHCGDTSKPVRVGYCVTPQEVVIQVEDQGNGFSPDD